MRLLRLGCLAVLVQLITARPLPHYLGPEIPQRLELLLRNQEARSYVPIKKPPDKRAGLPLPVYPQRCSSAGRSWITIRPCASRER
jgi:hypothetical protein